MLLVSPYVLHCHPAFWDDLEWFDLEWFTPARAFGCLRFAYFPFGGGLRRCIGRRLATLEMLVILATMAQAYELHPVPRYLVEPTPLSTLRPRHGLLVTLRQPRAAR